MANTSGKKSTSKRNKKTQIFYLVHEDEKGRTYKYTVRHRIAAFEKLELKKYNPFTNKREVFKEKNK